MKKLSNLKGAKALSKKEQQSILGGRPQENENCITNDDCLYLGPEGGTCVNNRCVLLT